MQMNVTPLVGSLVLALVMSSFAMAQVHSSGQRSNKTLSTGPRSTLGTESNRSASVRLGDVDGDGDLDAVVANGRHWPQQNFLFINQGRGKFSVMRPLGIDRATTYACELADLDGDGDLDLAIGNDMAFGQILLNDGAGNFAESGSFGKVASVRSLTVADVDSDGDNDILVTCRGMQNQIYLNAGDASFTPGPTYGTPKDSTIDVAVADLNKDGHQDLVLANRDKQPSYVLLNDGRLGFGKPLSFGSAKGQSRAVACGDLNGDGQLDWATGNIGQPNMVYLGDGQGGVLKSVAFGPADSRSYAISLADLNSDGQLDIVIGNAGQPNAVFFNEDQATRFRREPFGEANATYGLSVGDLNGDGRIDVAVANSDALNFVFYHRKNSKAAKRTKPVETSSSAKADAPSKIEMVSPTKSKLAQPTAAIKIAQETADTDVPFRERAIYHQTDWPSFRGTGARGVAEGYAIRTKWNAAPVTSDDLTDDQLDGVLWQTKVPGLGHSSPVIFGDKVFLVTAIASAGDVPLQTKRGGNVKAADDNGEQEWLVLCYDKTNGEELWRKTARKAKPRASRHPKATHANTSVCVDGKHVLAFLGSEGLYCFTMDGDLLWEKDLGVIDVSKYGIGWGFASSPAIHGDKVVIVCDAPKDPYVAALRLSDGEEIWRKSRRGVCERGWGTPLIDASDNNAQVVVNGFPWIVSYDLDTGEERWRVKGGGDNPVPSAFEAHGDFYITSAHGGPAPIVVVRRNAKGNLSDDGEKLEKDADNKSMETDAQANTGLVWRSERGGSYMSTPVVYEDYLYLGNSNGSVRCFNAKTGKPAFQKRLGSEAGVIASLVAADGKIFCASENGKVYVLKAGPEFKILAANEMGSPCFATPAFSEGVLFIRTTNRLVAIGDRK